MDEPREPERRVRVVGRTDLERMTPRRGEKAWFGPRRMGWGWDPVSWEGWVTSVVALALLLAPIWWGVRRGTVELWIVPWMLGTAGALVAICRAKGTSPGGPRLRKEFDRARRRQERHRRP